MAGCNPCQMVVDIIRKTITLYKNGKLYELAMTVAAMEKLLIQDALRRHEVNRVAAARDLDVDPGTLFRKFKALKLGAPSVSTGC